MADDLTGGVNRIPTIDAGFEQDCIGSSWRLIMGTSISTVQFSRKHSEGFFLDSSMGILELHSVLHDRSQHAVLGPSRSNLLRVHLLTSAGSP